MDEELEDKKSTSGNVIVEIPSNAALSILEELPLVYNS